MTGLHLLLARCIFRQTGERRSHYARSSIQYAFFFVWSFGFGSVLFNTLELQFRNGNRNRRMEPNTAQDESGYRKPRKINRQPSSVSSFGLVVMQIFMYSPTACVGKGHPFHCSLGRPFALDAATSPLDRVLRRRAGRTSLFPESLIVRGA